MINKKLLIPLFLLACLCVSALAVVVLYQLEIPNTMRLKTAYGLELKDYNDIPITSPYDWGDFLLGETKQMAEDAGKYCTIYNVGNVEVDVTWSVDNLPSEWLIQVYSFDQNDNPVVWNSGDTKHLKTEIYDWARIAIKLTEVSAVAGVDYSFTFKLEVVG